MGVKNIMQDSSKLLGAHRTISPLDGRYAERLEAQRAFFSEQALMYYRCKVEALYALALDDLALFAPMTKQERENLSSLIETFDQADYWAIKGIEAQTKHDVKACEIFLRQRSGLSNPHFLHFALTSEDANNLAYALMLQDHHQQVWLPQAQRVLAQLAHYTKVWAEQPFPARTHGQKASPTTAGKEMGVFLHRLLRVYRLLLGFQFRGKLNGAVGNYSAMLAAFPDIDWLSFSESFIQDLGLLPNWATTQIEDHDTFALYFNYLRQWNNIILDLDVDCWLYISRDLFVERSAAQEVGSSTMPHKVNPINFENSEGNLSLSNALLTAMSDKLSKSRMQRDLSDSTVQRNMGVALAHSYLAVEETLKGLAKLELQPENALAELQNSPELLAEPIQTMLKTAGIADPYDLLKQATRGKRPSHAMLMDLVDSLDLPSDLRQRIKALEVQTYLGDAVRIAKRIVEEYETTVLPLKPQT